jgi:hypothetical protein
VLLAGQAVTPPEQTYGCTFNTTPGVASVTLRMTLCLPWRSSTDVMLIVSAGAVTVTVVNSVAEVKFGVTNVSVAVIETWIVWFGWAGAIVGAVKVTVHTNVHPAMVHVLAGGRAMLIGVMTGFVVTFNVSIAAALVLKTGSVLVAVTVSVTVAAEFTVWGGTCATIGGNTVGLTVILTGAEALSKVTVSVAVTVKVAVSVNVTDGAVQLTGLPVVEPKVPGVPAVWAQVNVMGFGPVAVALKATTVPAVAVVGVAVTEVMVGAAAGLTVTLTDEVAFGRTPFAAVTWKVAVSVSATTGAVQATAGPRVELKVPGVPAIWAHVSVGAGVPVAVAVKFTTPPEVTAVTFALAVTVGAASTEQLDVGTGTVGNGLSWSASVPVVDDTPPLTRNAIVSKLSGGTGLPTTCSGKM